MSALKSITVMTDDFLNEAYLMCQEHHAWHPPIDGMDMTEVIEIAVRHIREDHCKHVENCCCREQVTDARCLESLLHLVLG